jgi:flagellar protein FliL
MHLALVVGSRVITPDEETTMSEAVADNAGVTAPTTAKRSKLPLMLAAVAVVAAGAGGAWYFLGKGKAEEGTEGATAEAAAAAPALYVKLEPPFVVNFSSAGKARFLQVAIEVMTRDPHVAEELDRHNPAIRNDLLLLLSNQQQDALASREGKEKLQQETLAAIRHVIQANGGEPESVEAALFTSFVMQ